jgi:pimeloyl-ACP methyl ester carboxylesterase
MATPSPLMPDILPAGIRARIVPGINGLAMHVLEAGFDPPGRPCVLLLHGFPELAYSWRKVMLPLARDGFHVIAPDQRGYGRSTGCDTSYAADLALFRPLNLVRDAIGLVAALGHRVVAAVIGHDFGAPVAAWCALLRPDMFRAVVLMSAPFGGPPALPFDTANAGPRPAARAAGTINDDLAALTPPRKHYQWHYAQPEANDDMWRCPQGVHDFLRAYYHFKSADWTGNRPFPLAAYTAPELARLPAYYVMDARKGMAETVAAAMPDDAAISACRWLPEDELRVYSGEYGRTGFQGGLNWYRVRWDERFTREAETFSGRTIDVPSAFIAGRSDWGVFQAPPAFERMQDTACTDMRLCTLVDGAGHWVQQEQPEAVCALLARFLDDAGTRRG